MDRETARQEVAQVARVVVADNDPDALELALTDLRLEGHEVYGAPGALEAELLIETLAPDVLVLDHRMPPGEAGLDLAGRLAVSHPWIRVVLYSNYQRAELQARALTIGVELLPKGNLHALRDAVGPA